MFTDIVVLYTAYLLNLPTWCKVLPAIVIVVKFIKIMCGIYKAGKENKGE